MKRHHGRVYHRWVIADVIAPGLRVLVCGINPGLMSEATGHHFARPGNRFWPALHQSGFTPVQLHPSQQSSLLGYQIGITNVVDRPSARADELTRDELLAGGRQLVKKVRKLTPSWLAVLGLGAYRSAFASPRAAIGEQPHTIGPTRVWVLPNPSGLNAHYTLPRLVDEFAALRDRAFS
jgi:TDG/mug DNA glycosylase family protein